DEAVAGVVGRARIGAGEDRRLPLGAGQDLVDPRHCPPSSRGVSTSSPKGAPSSKRNTATEPVGKPLASRRVTAGVAAPRAIRPMASPCIAGLWPTRTTEAAPAS